MRRTGIAARARVSGGVGECDAAPRAVESLKDASRREPQASAASAVTARVRPPPSLPRSAVSSSCAREGGREPRARGARGGARAAGSDSLRVSQSFKLASPALPLASVAPSRRKTTVVTEAAWREGPALPALRLAPPPESGEN